MTDPRVQRTSLAILVGTAAVTFITIGLALDAFFIAFCVSSDLRDMMYTEDFRSRILALVLVMSSLAVLSTVAIFVLPLALFIFVCIIFGLPRVLEPVSAFLVRHGAGFDALMEAIGCKLIGDSGESHQNALSPSDFVVLPSSSAAVQMILPQDPDEVESGGSPNDAKLYPKVIVE